MAVDQELVDAAIALARTRLGGTPWSGAAALRLDDGTVLTSTAPEFPNRASACATKPARSAKPSSWTGA
ncbi:hypothetical protein [Amycolatopsis sp. NPDC051061]|uniref:hypothetical protein n=1 Tax=Amycolatopsis sp. NPDC051061 TaxID=3155042 RepID=UPI003419AA10